MGAVPSQEKGNLYELPFSALPSSECHRLGSEGAAEENLEKNARRARDEDDAGNVTQKMGKTVRNMLA